MDNLKENMICPHCNKGILEFSKAPNIYDVDKLQCNHCDSTYII